MSRPSISIGVFDSVLLGAWTAVPARAEDLQSCFLVALQQARALEKCGLLVAIHAEQALPDAALRRVVQAEMRKLDPYLLCGATVFLRPGLQGVAMRSVVSTMQLLSRPTHPERIVSTGREAVKFVHAVLSRKLDKVASEAALAEAFDDFTRRVWSPA